MSEDDTEPPSEAPWAVVCGATGYAGGSAVRAFHAAGYRVRALARDPKRLGAVSDLCDDVFVGQATQPETLEGLFDGAVAGFSSIGIRHFGRHPTVWDVDHRANINLVEEAERAGVQRFAFVSLLGGGELRDRLPVAEARERVVDRLADSSMRSVIVRPTGFFNDMREIFDMAAGGRVWLVGDGHARINPIHGRDLADFAVGRLLQAEPGQQAYPIGGPDTMTMREIGELAFECLGLRPRFGQLPGWLLKGAATLARPVNINASTFLAMFALMADRDALGDPVGCHHLRDEYERAAQARLHRDAVGA